MQANEATEEESNKVRTKDDEEFGVSHQGFLIDSASEICFTWTSDRYQKTNYNLLSCGLLLMDKEGEIVDEMVFGGVSDKQKAFTRVEYGLRQPRELINMDYGLVVDLGKVPDSIKNIVVLAKIPEAQCYKSEVEAKKVKHAAYGV